MLLWKRLMDLERVVHDNTEKLDAIWEAREKTNTQLRNLTISIAGILLTWFISQYSLQPSKPNPMNYQRAIEFHEVSL